MAVAKKTPAVKTDEAAAPAPKVRKPRVPKPVNDLASANAAFLKAKKTSERADQGAAEAKKLQDEAHVKLAEAAKVLKGYLGEVDAAMDGVLPVEDEDVEDNTGDRDFSEFADYAAVPAPANPDTSENTE